MVKKVAEIKYDICQTHQEPSIIITHVNDVDSNIIELTLTKNKEIFELSDSCSASVSFVEQNTRKLIKDNMPCEITENGIIIIPIDNLHFRQQMDIDIEVTITDNSSSQVLTLPFPIWVRVNPSILDDAEVTDKSKGTVPELLEEAKSMVENFEYNFSEDDIEIISDALNIDGKADKSTTLSGYGITDAYTKGYIDQKLLELGGANVVNSVSDMVDTSRLYVLAETGHIWRYATSSTEPPNELDVKYYNKRISGSSGIDGVSGNGCFINEIIPVDLTADSCIITMKNFASNMGAAGTSAYGNSKIVALDENCAILGSLYIAAIGNSTCWYCPVVENDCIGDAVEFAAQLKTNGKISDESQIKYILLSPQISTSAISAADTANLGIYVSTHGGTTTAWVDTGITYGGGNEEVLTSLDIRMTAAENNIAELAESSTGVVIPSYWQTEVDDTVSKIKALQDVNGNNLLCFGWCSDMHIPVNGTAYEENIGSVAARVMKECNIPLFLMTGDMLTADTSTEISAMPTAYKKAWEYLSHIGKERIIAVKGNHDAWTGNDGNDNYYVKGLSPEKLYNQIFAPQAEDFKREFGADGSYFFIDYKPQKTRFICLNSHWAAYEENQDGTAKYSTQKGSGFGQAQFDWLAQTALNIPEDYSAVIALHVPPSDSLEDGRHYVTNDHSRDLNILRGIITAYCNKTSYSGSYTHSTKGTYLQEETWADVNISCDFSSYNGTLLGLFCGHSHYDQFVADDLPVPIVCITSAVNTPYDTSASVRVLGTKDETAFDFVCIDRSTGQINTVRCGYGNDRLIK